VGADGAVSAPAALLPSPSTRLKGPKSRSGSMACSELNCRPTRSLSRVAEYGYVTFDGPVDRPCVSRPALGSTQPPVQWVPGNLSPGAKARSERDADHSPPSNDEVENK
jgi:hypothetical protein